MTTDLEETTPVAEESPPATRRTLAIVLGSVIAVAALAAAVAVGYLWGSSGTDGVSLPSASSVDAGFAQDMSVHHQQAITMSAYVRDNSTDPAVANIAFDIETSQSVQMGEMIGWLDTYGISRNDPTPMRWMAGHGHVQADGLMPGMATPDQLNKLLSSHGKPMDILFLQLMIHHHQGGIQMANYAALHATEPYVRNVAQLMATAQTNEIITMEALLRQLGGKPLPPPPTH